MTPLNIDKLTDGTIILARHLCLALMLVVVPAAAETGGRDASSADQAMQKIHIEANHMKLNMVSGNSVYTGDVRISQGELVLTGDRVVLTHPDNTLQRLIVTGEPARYNHITEDGQTIVAESRQMEYTAAENLLVMTQDASLQQPDHMVTSQRIVYDTLKKIVIAGEATEGDALPAEQRVNITLTPKPKSSDKE